MLNFTLITLIALLSFPYFIQAEESKTESLKGYILDSIKKQKTSARIFRKDDIAIVQLNSKTFELKDRNSPIEDNPWLVCKLGNCYQVPTLSGSSPQLEVDNKKTEKELFDTEKAILTCGKKQIQFDKPINTKDSGSPFNESTFFIHELPERSVIRYIGEHKGKTFVVVTPAHGRKYDFTKNVLSSDFYVYTKSSNGSWKKLKVNESWQGQNLRGEPSEKRVSTTDFSLRFVSPYDNSSSESYLISPRGDRREKVKTIWPQNSDRGVKEKLVIEKELVEKFNLNFTTKNYAEIHSHLPCTKLQESKTQQAEGSKSTQ